MFNFLRNTSHNMKRAETAKVSNTQNKVWRPTSQSDEGCVCKTACNHTKTLQQHISSQYTSEKTKVDGVLLPEIYQLRLLSGSSSSSCTVGGESPYVPWEKCARVTLGHNTIRREICCFFLSLLLS